MPDAKQPGVGFVLPPNVQSNATNLETPGQIINTAVDPWGFLGDPYGVPGPQQQAQWQNLVCQRYGQPKPGENVLPLPGTARHSTDIEADLRDIAQLDPGWFKTMGYGPGPEGRNGEPTQLEVHDVQYGRRVMEDVRNHAKKVRTSGGVGQPPQGGPWIRGDAPGVGFVLPQGTCSNAGNLKTPLQPMDLSADPWGFLGNPNGVPTSAQQPEWQQLVRQRYGEPRDGDLLPLPGSALHSTDYEAALAAIVEFDPGWFQSRGLGPGPNGRDGQPTQLEIHDAQYANGLADQIIEHARDIQLAAGPGR